MTLTCPEGHQSEATDYCDTCGAPMTGGVPSVGGSLPVGGAPSGASPDPGPDPGAAAPSQTCPHCGAANLADALFCEACGYDFTTGAAPLDDAPEAAPPDSSLPESTPGAGQASEDDTLKAVEPAVAEEPEAPAEPEREPQAPEPETPEPGTPETPEAETPPATDAPEPDPPAAAQAPEPATPQAATPAAGRPRHTPPSRDLADTWVVEVWIDPDWYAVQQTEEACPSAGIPDVVLVRRTVVLVGRPSGSRGVSPDVDAGSDSAVSRRHAQLTSDGQRWWVEDLGSSNGTFVGAVGEPLPTVPLTPGQRVEVDRDDRIYVGAWTRLVIRQATAAERADQG